MSFSAEDFERDLLRSNMEALVLDITTREKLLEAAPEGETMLLPDGDPVLRFGDVVLGAPADESSRAQTTRDVASNPHGVVVVFGLGQGHSVRQIRERSNASLVVVEPNVGILRRVLTQGPTDLGGTRVVTSLQELRTTWPQLARGRSLATLVTTPGYEKAFPAQYAELELAVANLVGKVQINENTYRARSQIWLNDVFENLPALEGTVPLMSLTEKFAGVPAFIVGAGPSLNRNGALLQEATRKGIVLAVDVSGKILAHHGAEPQILVSIESIDLSNEVRDLPFLDRVLRAFSLLASPQMVRTGTGPWFPFHENMAEFESLNTLLGYPGVLVGGSVSTAAFSIAERLGCSPIILLGQDLAYPGGETYAAGCSFAGSRAKLDSAGRRMTFEWTEETKRTHGETAGPMPSAAVLHEVEAWGGEGTVPTTDAFNAFRSWFEVMAVACSRARPELRLLNCSEGGARIHGFEEAKLADVLSTLPIRGILPMTIEREARCACRPLTKRDLRRWSREQERLVRTVWIAAGRLRRVARAAMATMAAEDPRGINRAFRALARAESRLARASAKQHMPEAWACALLQHLTIVQQDRSTREDARENARTALDVECNVTEVVRRAACDLEKRFHALADRHGTEALPNMEKVRCLC